ncbi:MAG: alpha/beta fold hydrolase [Acidimicrobiales bacterium]
MKIRGLSGRPIGVPPIEAPRAEGVIAVGPKRHLGYAEFGDPSGRLVVWFHGTPGGRRQLPVVGRRAADLLGLRVVLVERPGSGASSEHHYRAVVDWADDIGIVADHLGHDRFAVVGLSGGGPYALACGARLADRVACVGVLGSVVPSVGPDASASGVVPLARTFNPILTATRWPLGTALWAVLRPLTPLAHPGYQLYARTSPPGDRIVFANPDIEAMFIDDLQLAAKHQFRAVVNDAILFGRDWGFRLADVTVPVRWWHGDADPIVPLEGAARAAALLPDCRLHVRPGESHLGGFAAADEVLRTVEHIWSALG